HLLVAGLPRRLDDEVPDLRGHTARLALGGSLDELAQCGIERDRYLLAFLGHATPPNSRRSMRALAENSQRTAAPRRATLSESAGAVEHRQWPTIGKASACSAGGVSPKASAGSIFSGS